MVNTVSDLFHLLTLNLNYMIKTFICIAHHHPMNDAENANMLMAIGIAVAVLSLIFYLIGFLYEGIKNRNWDLFNVFANFARGFGGFLILVMEIIWILYASVMKIYEWL